MKITKAGVESFLTIFFLCYFIIIIFMINLFCFTILDYHSSVEYMIPLFIVTWIFVIKSYKIFNIIGKMFRGIQTLHKSYGTYICTAEVIMDGTDNHITFTEGWEYIPITHYSTGYVFINDIGEQHYIPYYFLKIHFQQIK